MFRILVGVVQKVTGCGERTVFERQVKDSPHLGIFEAMAMKEIIIICCLLCGGGEKRIGALGDKRIEL